MVYRSDLLSEILLSSDIVCTYLEFSSSHEYRSVAEIPMSYLTFAVVANDLPSLGEFARYSRSPASFI